MPKKKIPVRNPWTKGDIRQLKAHLDNRLETIDVTSSCEPPRSYAVLTRDRRLGIRRSSEQWPELQDPPSNRFLGHVEPTLSEQIFDVAIAERETHIEPNGVAGDRRRKLVAGKRDRYPPSYPANRDESRRRMESNSCVGLPMGKCAYRMCKRYYWSARSRSQHCSGDASPGSECSGVIGLGGDAWGIQ